MAYRKKSRSTSSSRKGRVARKPARRANSRAGYSARKPRRNNQRVRKSTRGGGQTIRLEIISSPQPATPVEGLEQFRQALPGPKKARF